MRGVQGAEAGEGSPMRAALLALGYLWASPVSLVGLLACLLNRPSSARWRAGALEVTCGRFAITFGIQPAAVTLGWVILLAPDAVDDREIALHERAHVLQCLVLGPLVLVAYPLASLWAWARGGHYYEDNVFEVHAREVADGVIGRATAR